MDASKLTREMLWTLNRRGCDDKKIAQMSPLEAFTEYCEWNGLMFWGETLWNQAVALLQQQLAQRQDVPVLAEVMAVAPASQPEGAAQKVVVVLKDGCVDSVLATHEGLSVAVIDIDSSPVILDDLITIPRGDGTNDYALAGLYTPDVAPEHLARLCVAVEEAVPAVDEEDIIKPGL